MRAGYKKSPCSTYWVRRDTTSEPNAAPTAVPSKKYRTLFPTEDSESTCYPLLDPEKRRRFLPASFEIVERALLRRKYVDDNLAVV